MVATKRAENRSHEVSTAASYGPLEHGPRSLPAQKSDDQWQSLAHQINDPLAAAMNYLFAAKATLQAIEATPTHETNTYMELALEALEEISGAIRERPEATVTARGHDSLDYHSLCNVMGEAAYAAFDHRCSSRVCLSTTCTNKLPVVPIERAEMHRLIVNLLRYLLVSTPDGSASNFEISISTSPGKCVCIAIKAEPAVARSVCSLEAGEARQQLLTDDAADRLRICQAILLQHGGVILENKSAGAHKRFLFSLPNQHG